MAADPAVAPASIVGWNWIRPALRAAPSSLTVPDTASRGSSSSEPPQPISNAKAAASRTSIKATRDVRLDRFINVHPLKIHADRAGVQAGVVDWCGAMRRGSVLGDPKTAGGV